MNFFSLIIKERQVYKKVINWLCINWIYYHLFKNIGDLLADSDIVDIVKSMHTNIEREEEKEEKNEEKKITHKEAKASFDN